MATTTDLFLNDTGLTPSTAYDYVVVARDSIGNSPASDPVGVVTADSITPQELVAFGSDWRYLDDDSEQAGLAWSRLRRLHLGPAQLGYGDNDEDTVVSFGPDANDKHVTTWLRRTINIPDPSSFVGLSLGVVRDDGVVVYVNGQEVARDNLGAGTCNRTRSPSESSVEPTRTIRSPSTHLRRCSSPATTWWLRDIGGCVMVSRSQRR